MNGRKLWEGGDSKGAKLPGASGDLGRMGLGSQNRETEDNKRSGGLP